MIRLLGGLIDVFRRRFDGPRHDAHMDRIIAEARNAVEAQYGVADAPVYEVSRDPPRPMRDMARPGPAWFLHFGSPCAIGVLFVEIDDATGRVTRLWHTPR
jgi:hypothetical protein